MWLNIGSPGNRIAEVTCKITLPSVFLHSLFFSGIGAIGACNKYVVVTIKSRQLDIFPLDL